MNPKVITAPTQCVTTAVAKVHLRASSATTEDDLIVGYIEAARAMAQHYTGLAIGSQTLELAYDEFPGYGEAIELRYGPVTSITSVTYVDEDEITQTIDAANYSLDSYNDPGWVIPAVDYDWPTPIDAANCVKVRYVTGAAPAGAVLSAILLTVGYLFENREAGELPAAARALLDTVRVYG